ncbi:unnamed protein product [Ilex paraguariensis]|uniref:Uncharacterized protein n=1 Tax=Ilex paraguariensis TaxID=185542 RepID=A0ABC8UNG1_9AQUA
MGLNPQVKAFCKKRCDYFNLLELIFGKSIATVILARDSTQVPSNCDDEIELEEEFINGQKRSSTTLNDDLKGSFHPPPKKIASSSRQKRGSKSSKMGNAIDAWAAFSLARTEKYKHNCQNDMVNDAYSIDTCMDVLEGMEDVGCQQYFCA